MGHNLLCCKLKKLNSIYFSRCNSGPTIGFRWWYTHANVDLASIEWFLATFVRYPVQNFKNMKKSPYKEKGKFWCGYLRYTQKYPNAAHLNEIYHQKYYSYFRKKDFIVSYSAEVKHLKPQLWPPTSPTPTPESPFTITILNNQHKGYPKIIVG